MVFCCNELSAAPSCAAAPADTAASAANTAAETAAAVTAATKATAKATEAATGSGWFPAAPPLIRVIMGRRRHDDHRPPAAATACWNRPRPCSCPRPVERIRVLRGVKTRLTLPAPGSPGKNVKRKHQNDKYKNADTQHVKKAHAVGRFVLNVSVVSGISAVSAAGCADAVDITDLAI